MHEVVDNLTTDSGTDGLSARQGMNLKGYIDNITTNLNNLTSDVNLIDTRVDTLENSGGSGSSCSCSTKIWTEPVA